MNLLQHNQVSSMTPFTQNHYTVGSRSDVSHTETVDSVTKFADDAAFCVKLYILAYNSDVAVYCV